MRRSGAGALAVAWVQGAVAIVLGVGVVPRTASGAGWLAALAGLLVIAAGLTAVGGWRFWSRGPTAPGLALVVAGGSLASLPFAAATLAVLWWWWRGGTSTFATPGFLLGTLAVLGLPVAWTLGAVWRCVARRARVEAAVDPPALSRRRSGAGLAALAASLVGVAVASTWARWGVQGRVDELCHAADEDLAIPAMGRVGADAVPALARAADGGGPPELGSLAARGLAAWLWRGQQVFALRETVEIRGENHARLRAMRALARIGPEGQRVLLDRIAAGAPWMEEGLLDLGNVAREGGLAPDLLLSSQHVAALVVLADSPNRPVAPQAWEVSLVRGPAAALLVWAPGLSGRLADLAQGYPGRTMSDAVASETRELLRRHPDGVADLFNGLDAGCLASARFLKHVVRALGADSTAAIPHLVVALDSPHWGARAAALTGLARIGPGAAAHAERVAALVDDPHRVVRSEAGRALRALGAAARPR